MVCPSADRRRPDGITWRPVSHLHPGRAGRPGSASARSKPAVDGRSLGGRRRPSPAPARRDQPPHASSSLATISDDGDRVDLASTNLLLADQVEQVEAFAASLIADDIDLPIEAQRLRVRRQQPGGRGRGDHRLPGHPIRPGWHGASSSVLVTVEDLQTLSITVDVGEAGRVRPRPSGRPPRPAAHRVLRARGRFDRRQSDIDNCPMQSIYEDTHELFRDPASAPGSRPS